MWSKWANDIEYYWILTIKGKNIKGAGCAGCKVFFQMFRGKKRVPESIPSQANRKKNGFSKDYVVLPETALSSAFCRNRALNLRKMPFIGTCKCHDLQEQAPWDELRIQEETKEQTASIYHVTSTKSNIKKLKHFNTSNIHQHTYIYNEKHWRTISHTVCCSTSPARIGLKHRSTNRYEFTAAQGLPVDPALWRTYLPCRIHVCPLELHTATKCNEIAMNLRCRLKERVGNTVAHSSTL